MCLLCGLRKKFSGNSSKRRPVRPSSPPVLLVEGQSAVEATHRSQLVRNQSGPGDRTNYLGVTEREKCAGNAMFIRLPKFTLMSLFVRRAEEFARMRTRMYERASVRNSHGSMHLGCCE